MNNAVNNNLKLLAVFTVLKEVSNNSYLVGGCVRDFLLGLTPHDFDIVTDVDIETLTKLFTEAGWQVDTTGQNFLVTNVKVDNEIFEVAQFRSDSKTSDGRRPDSVKVGTIFEDAARRDFTVNALYLNPWTGEVLDPTGQGKQDVKDRVLRFVGKPNERLKEDWLRVMRFYRFLAKGFTPVPAHLRAVRENWNEALRNTNPERVRVEIEKMVGL